MLHKEAPLDEVIRVEDQYYILATSPLDDDHTRVFKLSSQVLGWRLGTDDHRRGHE
jgi:hypothetical protein